MLRMILSGVGTIILIGLGIALLNAFGWDFGAVVEWAVGLFLGLVNTVADWFTENTFFQRLVHS